MMIISGGQTGSDRAALDAAIAMGVAHGGWCPLHRRAEDGRIPDHYELEECESSEYSVRTEYNVRDSDATIIFAYGTTPGSMSTLRFTVEHNKPSLMPDLSKNHTDEELVRAVVRFIRHFKPKIINVAGSRESKAPGIHARVFKIMVEVLQCQRQ